MSLRISHIGVHDTHDLYSITILLIYDKEKHDKMKAILFNIFDMDLNTFLFGTIKIKMGHKLHVHTYNYKPSNYVIQGLKTISNHCL